jgi:integrase
MQKKPSNRKKSTRTFDVRRILKGRSYTAKELAKVCNVDESVIHRWRREEGLIPIDDKKPSMFYWLTVKQFLEHKNNAKKMKAGNEGDFPCFGCSLKRRAFESKIVLIKRNDKLWNAKAICSVCGSKMNMGVPADEFTLTLRWGYELVQELPKFSIIGTKQPSDTTTKKGVNNKKSFIASKEVNFCAENERIKHIYFDKVIHRFGKNNQTLRKIVSSILVFEEFNQFKNFKKFSYETAKEFQKYLLEKYSHSIQSAYRTMQALQEFFLWLKERQGYKRLDYDDIKSLRLSLKDTEKAKSSKPRKIIDLEKWEEMILNIKPKNEVETRGRAIFTLLLLSGVRIDALLTLRIEDLDLDKNYIFQDSNHVNTKFSQSHKTNLWKFRPEIKQILIDWVSLLKTDYNFIDHDPLFPRIQMTANDQFQFEKDGYKKEFIKQPDVIRKELSKQFENANLDYHTPHTIRHSLTSLFMGLDLSLEQIKAVSQNLSHKNLETTFNGYYQVHEFKKDQIIDDMDIEKMKNIKRIKDNPKYKYIMANMTDETVLNKVFDALTKN